MNGQPKSVLIALGHAGAGKTTLTQQVVLPRLRKLGYDTDLSDDRLHLEWAVRLDVVDRQGGDPYDPDLVGVGHHSTLTDGRVPGNHTMGYRDGAVLNRAHAMQFDLIRDHVMAQRRNGHEGKRRILVAEVATGVSKEITAGEEAIRQSGPDVIDWIEKRDLLGEVAIIDIRAPLDQRVERVTQRIGNAVPEDVVRDYFFDAGYMTDEDISRLGEDYRLILNEGRTREEASIYMTQIEAAFHDFIMPQLGLEGVGRPHPEL
ncbi:hypothetical protein M1555_05260 [Patescibacteria group bacterium]|nr:hypothetical protein [Patescibacteria group bacterium]